MDEDMEAVEIVFAQRLASGEPTIRKRALKHLRNHIKEESAKIAAFSPDSLARLCKGLHYTIWMQDKMILQEELADEICALLTLFRTDEQMLQFVKAMITSLSKEWPFIDRWRMDKFLMLLRRLIRTLFLRMLDQNVDQLSESYIQMFRETLINAQSSIFESLKYHCASIWLDELDNASTLRGKKIDEKHCLAFIRPYIQQLQEPISDTYFRIVCSEIFGAILYDCEENLKEKQQQEEEEEKESEGKPSEKVVAGGEEMEKAVEEEDEHNKNDENDQNLKFDYKQIAIELFDAGKQPHVPGKRRKRIYALCKKFECAAQNLDPFPVTDTEPIKPKMKQRRKKSKGRSVNTQ